MVSMKSYKAYLFDFDRTLAESRSPISDEMAALLCRLMSTGAYVSIISGSEFDVLKRCAWDRLPCRDTFGSRFFLQPTTGARMFKFDSGEAAEAYAYLFTKDEEERVLAELKALVEKYPDIFPQETEGPRFDMRGTQITLAALGRDAKNEHKYAWDPDRSKRNALVAEVAPRLKGFAVGSGGSTSIDVTREGVDKAFGIFEFLKHTGLTVEDILFVGDSLEEGGTDYPAKTTGADTLAVTGPTDLLQKFQQLLTNV